MARNHEVLINEEKCIGCGLCVSDCVAFAISLENGKAKARQGGCIACGHCEAICPQNAVTLTGFKDESIGFDKDTRLDPSQLLQAIRTRRSIRKFKTQEVPQEMIDDIIEAGRLAPTGGNSQGTGYIILGSKQNELEGLAVCMFRKLVKSAKVVYSLLKNMEIDDNFFFKGAPLVIVITGDRVNASLAAQNMAFMAEAHGLGVLYSGFFTMCVNHNRRIRSLMKMEKNEKAVTTLVIGHPAVRYHRTARREEAKVRIL